MKQRKPRVALPNTYRSYLPRMYDMLKETGYPRPYEFMAEVFGVSVSLVQKVTLAERYKGLDEFKVPS
jgi:hypothetical protein